MAVRTTKLKFNQDVDLRAGLSVEGKAEFGSDVEVDGQLAINSASDLKTKDGTGFASKSDLSTLATKEELNAKQSTLYRHTVCIINANAQLGPFALSFTAESEKNLEIDSIQDLISVFGNTSLSCNGFLWDSVSNSSAPYGAIVFRINIGTALASCTVDYYIFSQTDGPELTYGEDSSLTDFIGTSGFTISDTVTAM